MEGQLSQYTMALGVEGTLDGNALERLGGKGKSLAAMASAGFNVPAGFVVSTSAYRDFVSDHALQPRIIELAKPAVVGNRVSFDESSENVHALFQAGGLAPDIVSEVARAYAALGDNVAVAVRSSANAEDLPDLSFAGQQETYLNVRGEDEIIAAVKACWASLWTARAIDYRHQNGIDQNGVAMAVVVQVMVPSSVSGILFTANPATGERAEMVVNASFGLGEAVVSGEVTPDTYIVDRATGIPRETVIGAKEQMTVSAGAQGTRMEDVSASERDRACLSDDMVSELTRTALAIENLYDGVPQDIEWGFSADGSLSLLQSRPITNLPVQPIDVTWEPPPPARILYRRQIVENMPDPICELFEELYLTEGLEYARRGQESMVRGGGAHFVTCNGYAYCRADHKGTPDDPNMAPEEMEAMAQRMLDEIRQTAGTGGGEGSARHGPLPFGTLRGGSGRVSGGCRRLPGRQPRTRPHHARKRQSDLHRQPQDAGQRPEVEDLAGRGHAAVGRGRREVGQAGHLRRHRRATPGRHSGDGHRGRVLLERQHQPHVRHRQVHGRSPAVLPAREHTG